jgi:hypothetical protein
VFWKGSGFFNDIKSVQKCGFFINKQNLSIELLTLS